jgi:tripartite-type tricarboxylate transporter receptor subunit TctC
MKARHALFGAALAAAAGLVTATGPTMAAYPDHPVHLVVPFASGGAADILARTLASGLPAKIGGSYVVDNKDGGASTIGTQYVVNARPDGYTLLLDTGTLSVAPSLIKDVSYDITKDLVPITYIGYAPMVLLANPKAGIHSVQDLIDKAKAHPGEISFASGGIGSSFHLAMAMLQNLTDTKMIHVPYRGGAPGMIDLIAGHVSVMFNLMVVAMPNIQSGRLVPIAVDSDTRSSNLPRVPTLKELGFGAIDGSNSWGVSAPKNTPPDIISKLHDGMAAVLTAPEIRQRLENLGVVVVASTPEDYRKRIDDDFHKWAKVIHDNNITAN